MEADLATMPIPGMCASPRQARKLGFTLIDERAKQLRDGPIGSVPLWIFDDWVAALQALLEKGGSMTSEKQCRYAMADCIAERSLRDRTWNAEADRDRRRARR